MTEPEPDIADVLRRLDRLERLLAYWFWRAYCGQGLPNRVAYEQATLVDQFTVTTTDTEAEEGGCE